MFKQAQNNQFRLRDIPDTLKWMISNPTQWGKTYAGFGGSAFLNYGNRLINSITAIPLAGTAISGALTDRLLSYKLGNPKYDAYRQILRQRAAQYHHTKAKNIMDFNSWVNKHNSITQRQIAKNTPGYQHMQDLTGNTWWPAIMAGATQLALPAGSLGKSTKAVKATDQAAKYLLKTHKIFPSLIRKYPALQHLNFKNLWTAYTLGNAVTTIHDSKDILDRNIKGVTGGNQPDKPTQRWGTHFPNTGWILDAATKPDPQNYNIPYIGKYGLPIIGRLAGDQYAFNSRNWFKPAHWYVPQVNRNATDIVSDLTSTNNAMIRDHQDLLKGVIKQSPQALAMLSVPILQKYILKPNSRQNYLYWLLHKYNPEQESRIKAATRVIPAVAGQLRQDSVIRQALEQSDQ